MCACGNRMGSTNQDIYILVYRVESRKLMDPFRTPPTYAQLSPPPKPRYQTWEHQSYIRHHPNPHFIAEKSIRFRILAEKLAAAHCACAPRSMSSETSSPLFAHHPSGTSQTINFAHITIESAY